MIYFLKKVEGGLVTKSLGQWKELVSILVGAVFLSFAINVLSTGLSDMYKAVLSNLSNNVINNASNHLIVFAVIMAGASLWWINQNFQVVRTRKRYISGFFAYNRTLHAIMNVEQHGFSNFFNTYIRKLLIEKENIKRIWQENPLDNGTPGCEPWVIVRDAAEYYVLRELANVLRRQHRRSRDEQPVDTLDIQENKNVFAGLSLERLEFFLPKGSTILRTNDIIKVESKLYILEIRVYYDNHEEEPPFGFSDCYLDNPRDEITFKMIEVDFLLRLKAKVIISRKKWDDITWIDSFFDRINQGLSLDEFLKTIGWNPAVMRVITTQSKDIKDLLQLIPPTESFQDGEEMELSHFDRWLDQIGRDDKGSD